MNPTLQHAIPGFSLDCYRLLRAWPKYIQSRRVLARNKEWKNCFQGARVFVLANGPSLREVDRRVFGGRPVIVMNSFDRSDWKAEVNIVAHCIGEPRRSPAWQDPTENIVGTDSASYWLHHTSIGAAVEIPQKSLHYVLPAYEPLMWGRRKIDLERLTLVYQTTAQLAIMVALFMGFKDIVLLGFDHDWLASPKFSRHFYSDTKDSTDMLGTHPYHDLMKFSLRMWEIYYAIRRAAGRHGASIVNYTESSYLDVFPRAQLSNLPSLKS